MSAAGTALFDPRDLGERVAVEIAATARTGLGLQAAPGVAQAYRLPFAADAVPLSAADAARLGSHFARCGALDAAPDETEETIVDRLGVTWLRTPDGLAVLDHPLEDADAAAIARHAFPPPPAAIQRADGAGLAAMMDAPLPGLVETCLLLRGGWNFLGLCAGEDAEAEALLDWSAEALGQAYGALFGALEEAGAGGPAVVVYRDILGTEAAPFFSRPEFARLVLPRLRRVFEGIAARTKAPIMVAVQGAARPLLGPLVEAGAGLVGIDCNARGMIAKDIRRDLGRATVLHGTVDLCALGMAVAARDLRAASLLACELAEAMPVIAAPAAPLAGPGDVEHAALGAAFLAQLTQEDWYALARLGPVRATIERALADARATRLPAFTAPSVVARPKPARAGAADDVSWNARRMGGVTAPQGA